jgi:NAD-reducing hydrogenase large subunit
MVEIMYSLERAEAVLKDDRICGTEIRTTAPPAGEEGVGVIEAPRGTLIHHYQVDARGAIRRVNLIVATGHNNQAMNQSVKLVAREFIHRGEVREGLLNRVEGAIRCYDPCLSCSTHALGQMPLRVEIHEAGGNPVGTLERG